MSNLPAEENSYDKDYRAYHIELLQAFVAQIEKQPPFNSEIYNEEDAEFLAALKQLPNNSQNAEWLDQGQSLFCRIVSSYPHLMPLLYRDLLWFFGGDCLHYMPDDEIERFQQLDEQREAAKSNKQVFNHKEARAKIMGMH